MTTLAIVLAARPLELTAHLAAVDLRAEQMSRPVYRVAQARRDVLVAVARRDARAVERAGRSLVSAIASASG